MAKQHGWVGMRCRYSCHRFQCRWLCCCAPRPLVPVLAPLILLGVHWICNRALPTDVPAVFPCTSSVAVGPAYTLALFSLSLSNISAYFDSTDPCSQLTCVRSVAQHPRWTQQPDSSWGTSSQAG